MMDIDATTQPLRLGIMGTGIIAEDFCNALSAASHNGKVYTITAVGARSADKAEKLASRFSIPRAHSSFEDLCADTEVDVVYVATPDALHAQHCILAMNSGKHVLCEKPFTQSLLETQEVLELSRTKKLFCMEAMWTAFVPIVRKALQIVEAGEIGEINFIAADFGCKFDIPAGALNALGCYNLALTQLVLDAQARAQGLETPVKPSRFTAVGSLGTSGVDRHISVSAQYGDRCISNTYASLLCDSHREALVVGTKGRLRLLGPLWHSGTELILEKEGCESEMITVDEESAYTYAYPFNLLNSQRLVHQVLEVERCIRSGSLYSDHWTHAQIEQVQLMMDECRKQLRAACVQ